MMQRITFQSDEYPDALPVNYRPEQSKTAR